LMNPITRPARILRADGAPGFLGTEEVHLR
jgi:hypothetical protein